MTLLLDHAGAEDGTVEDGPSEPPPGVGVGGGGQTQRGRAGPG